MNTKNIHVMVNKEKIVLPEGTTVSSLLELRKTKARASVWVNGSQLLLAEYPARVLEEGDTVKILRVVAGG